ncbi:MAG: hypothetical protein R3E89_07565 [Thiolinea sp.]
MRSTITSRGQTVIPAEVRRFFHLSSADRLEWIIENNTIRVIPVHENPVDAFRGSSKRRGSTTRLLEERTGSRARMKRYLLDTSALLTLRDDEEGADVVAELLYQHQNGQARVLPVS